jgi:hypothetical protein
MSAERLCPAARAVSRADRRHAPLQSQRGFTLPPAKASWAMALPTRGWLHRRPAAAGPWCAQSGTCRLPAPRHAGRSRADRCEARSGPSFLRLLPSARPRTRWIRAGCGCDRRVRGSGRRRFRQVSFSSVSSSCVGCVGPREPRRAMRLQESCTADTADAKKRIQRELGHAAHGRLSSVDRAHCQATGHQTKNGGHGHCGC